MVIGLDSGSQKSQIRINFSSVSNIESKIDKISEAAIVVKSAGWLLVTFLHLVVIAITNSNKKFINLKL